MATRAQLLRRVAERVGDPMTVEAVRDGWPGLVAIGEDHRRFCVHFGPIGLSHRGRDDVERRFQNPGSGRPLAVLPSTGALLLGLWEGGHHPVLVAADGERRIGLSTRYSVFTPLRMLEQAASIGWAEHTSTSEESLVAFHPALLPAYSQMLLSSAQVNGRDVVSILDVSGLLENSTTPAGERARRATMTLVRSAAFSRQVLEAYGGLCAMCGLGLGLCQGAHIYPAIAPGSPDEATNGLALCSNHHVAFDRHLLWVNPADRTIRFHPSFLEHAFSQRAAKRFVDGTETSLHEPASPILRPPEEMFHRRYTHFGDDYGWIG